MSVAMKSPTTSIVTTLSWAVYLGMSWTWCIGMFLPVILVSEFGLSIWFVFAIPNVIGAAAMAWVLKTPGRSEKLVADHHGACVAFSAVTLAFQIFFLFWMSGVGRIPVTITSAAIAIGVAGGWIGRRKSTIDLAAGWGVLVVGLIVLGRGLMYPQIADIDGSMPDKTAAAWIGLGPVSLLGFLLCPYLDLTFHRARQQLSSADSKKAFGFGFGVFFLAMIVLTLLYVGDFSGRGGSFGLSLSRWVGTYMAVQIGFTIAVHLRAIPTFRKLDVGWWAGGLALLALGTIVMREKWADGELVYRLFMSFYGLVFPAYVWVCVLPWRKQSGTANGSLIACAIAIALAGPLFWIGFIDERMIWLVPATVIVLGGGLLRQALPAGRGDLMSGSKRPHRR